MMQFRISDFGLRIAGEAPRRSRCASRLIRNPQSAIRIPPRGFTLLEVILALVVLGAALAMLGEVMQLASRHAVEARAETQAQSLATSIMDQLLAGALEVEPVTREAVEVDDSTPWVYSISIGKSDLTGVEPVEVLVEQDLEARVNPVRFRLLRWLPTVIETPETGSPAQAGGQTGGGQTGQSPGGSPPPGGTAEAGGTGS